MHRGILAVALLLGCGRSHDQPLGPLPVPEGFRVVSADRQEGPRGKRLRVEGWIEVSDVAQAKRRFDAYVAVLEQDGFRPSDESWREVLSCTPQSETSILGCRYQAFRGGPQGDEALLLEAEGVDTLSRTDGSELGRGMALQVEWTQTAAR